MNVVNASLPPCRPGYREAMEKLSPELRAAVLEAAMRAGHDDQDPLWGLYIGFGNLMECYQAQISALVDTAVEKRFQSAMAATVAARDRQNKEIKGYFQALHHQRPGSVALWNCVSMAIAALLAGLLIAAIDDARIGKERVAMQAEQKATFAAGWQAHERQAATHASNR